MNLIHQGVSIVFCIWIVEGREKKRIGLGFDGRGGVFAVAAAV